MSDIKYSLEYSEYFQDDIEHDLECIFKECDGVETIEELVEKIDDDLNYESYHGWVLGKSFQPPRQYSIFGNKETSEIVITKWFDDLGEIDSDYSVTIHLQMEKVTVT